MIDLTRRGFLGTLLAVPIAASIPPRLVAAAEFVYEAPAIVGPLVGRILKIRAHCDWLGSEAPEAQMAKFGLVSVDGTPLILNAFSSLSGFIYRPFPPETPIATQDRPLLAYVESLGPMWRPEIQVLLSGDDGVLYTLGNQDCDLLYEEF